MGLAVDLMQGFLEVCFWSIKISKQSKDEDDCDVDFEHTMNDALGRLGHDFRIRKMNLNIKILV